VHSAEGVTNVKRSIYTVRITHNERRRKQREERRWYSVNRSKLVHVRMIRRRHNSSLNQLGPQQTFHFLQEKKKNTRKKQATVYRYAMF